MILTLCYHSISENSNDIFSVDPAVLERQLISLKKRFTIISPAEIHDTLKGGRYALITFDDGFLDFFTKAYPILSKHQIKASIFIPTQFIDGVFYKYKMMSPRHLKVLKDDPLITIASHTHEHLKLDSISDEKTELQYTKSIGILESILQKKVNLIACPHGKTPQNIDLAKKYFSHIFSEEGCWQESPRYIIKRTLITRNMYFLKFLFTTSPALSTFRDILLHVRKFYRKKAKNVI